VNWHTYKTIYEIFSKRGDIREMNRDEQLRYYEYLYRKYKDSVITNERVLAYQAATEINWIHLRRPFFNVWPFIGEGLIKTKLDISCDIVKQKIMLLPECLNIRFAIGHELGGIQTVLSSRVLSDGVPGLKIYTFTGEIDNENLPVYNRLVFPIQGYETIEQSLDDLPKGGLNDEEYGSCVNGVKMVIMLGLMFNEPDLIEQIVLKRDASKVINNEIIERAKRNGVVGWNVGSHIEISPHYRHPHFGHRWCGPGKRDLRIVPIKGAIIKRNKATEVPTGYDE